MPVNCSLYQLAVACILQGLVADPALGQADDAGWRVHGTAMYARAFDGGGLGLRVGADVKLFGEGRTAHRLGVLLRHSWSSMDDTSIDRTVSGLGAYWKIQGRGPGREQPYVSVPLLLMRGAVPDVTHPLGTSTVDEEDLVGSNWGVGVGLEGGLLAWLTPGLGLHLQSTVLYQTIYSNNRSLLWDVGAGITLPLHK